jgi:hypothetical protein
VRRAVAFLRVRLGGVRALAKTAGLTYATASRLSAGRGAVSARTALRVARAAGAGLQNVLEGRWPPGRGLPALRPRLAAQMLSCAKVCVCETMRGVGLKYADELPRCVVQPCSCLQNHVPRQLVLFRVVHKDATEADFVPVCKMPGRTSHGTPQCSNLALSFFNTLNNARRRYRDLVSRGIDMVARSGDHIGQIDILQTDGHLSKKPSSTGHLNLFQDEAAVFAHRVKDYQPAVLPQIPAPGGGVGGKNAS